MLQDFLCVPQSIDKPFTFDISPNAVAVWKLSAWLLHAGV